MNVYIDGDGCPVVRQSVDLCRRFRVPCTIVCDTSHTFSDDYARVVICSKGADSADYRLVGLLRPGDLCITQDYGLAALCLSRGARAMNQDGMHYTDANIGGLLEARAFAGNVRRGGGRLRGPRKRTRAQDEAFVLALRRILEAPI